MGEKMLLSIKGFFSIWLLSLIPNSKHQYELDKSRSVYPKAQEDILLCPQPKDIHLTVTEQSNQKLFIFKKVELENLIQCIDCRAGWNLRKLISCLMQLYIERPRHPDFKSCEWVKLYKCWLLHFIEHNLSADCTVIYCLIILRHATREGMTLSHT